jgi:hypothetical protein
MYEKGEEGVAKRRKEYLKNRKEAVSFLPAGRFFFPSVAEVCPSAKSLGDSDLLSTRWVSDEHEMVGGGLKFDRLVAKHISNKEYAQKKTANSKNLMSNVQYRVHTNKVLAALDGAVGLKKYRIYSLFAKRKDDEELDLSELMASFSTVLHNIVQEFIKEEKLKPDDRIQIVMTTEKGVMNNPISSKVQKVEDFDVSSFLVHAAAYFQSDKTLKISDRILLELIHIKMDRNRNDIGVGGRTRFKILNLKNAVSKKVSCCPITNTDNLCLIRAIILCLAKKGVLQKRVSSLFCKDNEDDKPYAYLLKETTCRFLNIRRSVTTHQQNMAEFFCRKGGVVLDKGGGVADIEVFESLLSIQIKIFDGCNFMKLIHSGPPSNDVIYLLRSEGEKSGTFHYDSILNVRGFLGKFFCDFCNVSHREKFSHRCFDIKDWCFTCNHRECFEKKIEGFGERCDSCFRVFRSPFCKQIHLGKDSVCGFFKCFDCGRYLARKKVKKDGVWVKETYKEVMDRHAGCSSKCSVCHQQVSEGHVCFMRKTQFKKFVKKVVYLDFETNFETGEHIPVFCHLKWVFRKSFDDKDEEIGEKSFGVGKDVSKEVGEFLFSPFFKDSTVIAHNLKAFDGCFLIQYMTANSMKPSNVITNGTKVTYMFLHMLNMRFVDSLNLIPLPLSGFSEAFGISELGKGFFPYLFVKKDNFKYVGPFPDPSFYGIDEMSEQKREEFFEWYRLQKGKVFNFREEIARYCQQDVEILFQGVETFRRLLRDLTMSKKRKKIFSDELSEYEYSDDDDDSWCQNENSCSKMTNQVVVDICPAELKHESSSRKRKAYFDKEQWTSLKKQIRETSRFCDPVAYCTLASVCHSIFKTMFLKKNTIAQTPSGGYLNHQYSNRCIEWLEFLNFSENRQIIHQRNSSMGEIKVGTFRVDGFEKSTKTIFEFNGCFFHGHEACIVDMNATNPVLKKTYQALWDKTQARQQLLEKKGYRVVVMWGCEWEKQRKSEEVLSFLSTCGISSQPLNPKDAFFGGRVECFKLVDEGEIASLDVNSLYPFVLATKKFPVGHPTIIISNTGTDLSPYFGFVKCDVAPPSDLLIPVLPVKFQGKLIFGLCQRCIEDQVFGYCPHSENDRVLSGTWFSEELKLAVSKGYRVLKIHQVYHFNQQSSRLFAPFIRKFFKLKLLSSGRPKNIDMDEFIKMMKEVEKVDIDSSQFQDNPGVRFIAKIILNSFWGRFAMREIRPQFTFASTMKEVYGLISNENIEVKSVRPIRSNIVGCTYEMKDISLVDVTNDRNIFIAAITTAWARIVFYNFADRVSTRSETQMIYGDTDSFYVNLLRAPFAKLTPGPYLGNLSNELKDGEIITSMAAPSPKSYAYLTNKKRFCVKFKGFSLGFETKKGFLIGNMKTLVEDFVKNNADEDGCVQFPKNLFSRTEVCRTRDFFMEKHLEYPDKVSSCFERGVGVSIFNPRKIKRTETWVITSQHEQKLFLFDYDKRIVLKDFSTIPFGYKVRKSWNGGDSADHRTNVCGENE